MEVWLDHQAHKAHYRGLATCGSVWTCPVCASKISEKRRIELEAAVAKSGLTPVLVTVTLQHSRQDPLKDLIEDLTNTLRSLKSGGWWQRFKDQHRVKAYVSSLEVTWGAENGWHPHKHWLLFVEMPVDQVNSDQLKAQLTARYTELLAKVGRYASNYYGIDLIVGQPAAVEVGRYVTKWGLASEVTKAVVKNGRSGLSPWQLLEAYAEGDQQAGALFVEYAKATQGKRQLVWSQGARQILALGAEQADEDLAAAEEDQPQAEMLIKLDFAEWQMILKHNARSAMLDLAEQGGLDAVTAYLEILFRREAGT